MKKRPLPSPKGETKAETSNIYLILQKSCFPVFLFFCLLICLPVALFSQDTTIVLNKLVTIKQDAQISQLLSKYEDYNSKKEFTDGYRVQIMYTDVRDEVYKSKGKTYREFPELPSYVEYEEPYYKLRL